MIPGGFQKRKKVNLKKIFKRLFKHIYHGEWSALFFYLCSEISNILFKRELFITKPFECPLCLHSSYGFINLSNHHGVSWNSACPECNSRSRHRGLFFLYREYLHNTNSKRILHFSPEPILERYLRQLKQHEYYTTDYHIKDVDYPGQDIQNLTFEDSIFDLIIINHVLEHIEDDKKALVEMARVLKKGGVAIITIPGDWKRKFTKNFNHLYFNGHYRDYGLEVYKLMESIFPKVTGHNLFIYDGGKHSIKSQEIAFICKK